MIHSLLLPYLGKLVDRNHSFIMMWLSPLLLGFSVIYLAFVNTYYEFVIAWLLVSVTSAGCLYTMIFSVLTINLTNNAKYLFPDLKTHEDEWLGFRPTLPDFLPVLGESKNHKNLFYSFGHHHLGWTLGAISGKIVSNMIAGENTNLDLSAYNSTRFS